MLKNYVSDIRSAFRKLYYSHDYTIDKSGVKTLEIINANFVCDEETIFGTVNKNYVERELCWYYSQSLNINDIPGNTPGIWKSVADDYGYINSNYGYLIFSSDNCFQYKNCLDELKQNPNSRRAVMIYNRPSIWEDFNRSGRNDFICTFATQHFIKNGELITIVNMRSNDAIFGFKNDYQWFNHIHKRLATELNVLPGNIEWNAGSLHIYERHFKLIEE